MNCHINGIYRIRAKEDNNTGADPGFDQGGAPDRNRPKTAILGPQFCRILVLGPHFWWSGGGPGPRAPPPGSATATTDGNEAFVNRDKILW